MGETVKYISPTEGTVTLSADARYIGGGGLDQWHVEPIWVEKLGDSADLDGYGLGTTEWTVSFGVEASSYENARETLAAWRKVFMRDVSHYERNRTMGTVQIVHNGGTYSIAAAHTTPDIANPQNLVAQATLRFQSPSPFWSFGAAASTVSAFSGTATVNVTYDNTGDFELYPVHIITGAMGTPRLTDVGTGDYIEIGAAWAGAADQVWVWPEEPLIRYYAGGTSAGDKDLGTNYTKYAGTVSTFFVCQVGAGTVQLSAASGTATYEMQHTLRKAGIG